MACPTREEYEEALESKNFIINALELERERRDDLIHKLCDSQNCLDSYKSTLESINTLIQKYKIYQELSENHK